MNIGETIEWEIEQRFCAGCNQVIDNDGCSYDCCYDLDNNAPCIYRRFKLTKTLLSERKGI